MKEQLQAIIALQKCDQELKLIEKKLAQKEKVKEIFEQKKHKDKLKENIAMIMDNLEKVDEKLANLNWQHEELARQVAALTKKLYSGEEQDAKELVIIQEKIKQLTSKKESLEILYYNCLEERETLINEEQLNKKAYQELKPQLTKAKINFKEEREQLFREKERAINHRDKLEELIDKDLLKRYNQKQGDELVVPVINGNCGYCRVKVNFELIRVLKKQETIERCEYCGKILIFQ